MKGLNEQKSLGNDQYPKTTTESNNMLSNHCFDEGYNQTHKNKKTKNQGNEHINNEENDTQNNEVMPPLTFTQMEGCCYCCEKYSHKLPDYNKKIQYLGKSGLSKRLNTHSKERKVLVICQVFQKHNAVTKVKHTITNTRFGLMNIMHSIKSWICES